MSMRSVALILGVLALAPALASTVGAQEPFTHRYLVEGRLLGANGAPIGGAPVTVVPPSGELTQSCTNVVDNASTDEWGDFAFCFSQTTLHDGVLHILVGSLNLTRPIDQNFRRTVIFARDPEQNGTAPPDWNATFRIAGRVLVPGSAEFGGVQAYGVPVSNETMNVTVRTPNATSPLTLHTDGNGDFDAVIRLLDPAEEAQSRATLSIRGQHLNRYLDPEFHRINVRMGIQSGAAADVQTSFDNDGLDATPARPGDAPPPISGGLILVAAASLGLIVYALRRANKK